jgi:hypothetical protein
LPRRRAHLSRVLEHDLVTAIDDELLRIEAHETRTPADIPAVLHSLRVKKR